MSIMQPVQHSPSGAFHDWDRAAHPGGTPMHTSPWMTVDRLHLLADVDRTVHEPARLMILGALSLTGRTDFVTLLRQTGLTRGNLSSHMTRLEEAGYIEVEKRFVERIPQTLLRLTESGREAFEEYRRRMLRALG